MKHQLKSTAETGALMTSRRDFDSDKGWNWLRAEGPIADYLELIPQGSDTFEAVVKDGWPAKIMSNREDGAYCTKDLVLRHPQNKAWFKYIGRLDDTLTQTLGEKTNPVPIELAIVSHVYLLFHQGTAANKFCSEEILPSYKNASSLVMVVPKQGPSFFLLSKLPNSAKTRKHTLKLFGPSSPMPILTLLATLVSSQRWLISCRTVLRSRLYVYSPSIPKSLR